LVKKKETEPAPQYPFGGERGGAKKGKKVPGQRRQEPWRDLKERKKLLKEAGLHSRKREKKRQAKDSAAARTWGKTIQVAGRRAHWTEQGDGARRLFLERKAPSQFPERIKPVRETLL